MASDPQLEARHRRIRLGLGRQVREQQEPALGPRDAHDGVEDLLQDLAQDEGRVQRLDQRQQQLLLLDPGELRDLLGRSVRPEQRELEGDVAQLDLRAVQQGRLLHLGGVDVHAVQAALVLDGEAAVLVGDPRVRLGDRRLGERQVVVAGPSERVRAGLQEVDLLRQVPADDLEQAHRKAGAAVRAAMRVVDVLPVALGTEHEAR